MKIFGAYIKQKSKILLIILLFCIIFAIVFYLYKLPVEAVIYPSLLCILFGTILIVLDFAKIKRRHKILEKLGNMPSAMIDELPSVSNINDYGYQRIIRSLQKEISQLEADSNNRFNDMVDYYTVWAHQIKTPIASMRLTLQNEDTPLSRKLLSDLFRIEQYVEMIMAFLRLDSTSSDYVFKEHNIDTIIRQAVKKYANEFIDRKISLVYNPINYTVVTDDKWLSFVIEQILSNALKYTRKGSIKIYMNENMMLCIEDTGIGIAPEDLPRIFEKGYTGYNGRNDKKASGLGLYLCKRICKNLDTGITVLSEIDKGTIVRIDLKQ
ncbi:MAG TPA: hypothetical protein DD413_00155 [Ruminococcus sp.]|nr:hypothetical protein [Ruminococcus sp.]